MEVLNFFPPEVLKPFVKYTSFISADNTIELKKTFVPVIDGCPGIMLQDEDFGTIFKEDKDLPASILFGQSTRYAELELNGSLKMICVYLQPHALGSLFKLNAEVLTDSCLDFRFLPKGSEAINRIGNSTTVNDKVTLLYDYLLANLDGHSCRDLSISYALEKIITSKGRYSLKQLKNEVNLSERTFERKFKQQVGISAKLFSRICMFQSSFQQIANREYEKLTDVALENIYADQSHFIRSFKEFAGFSPIKYQRKSKLVAENLSEILV